MRFRFVFTAAMILLTLFSLNVSSQERSESFKNIIFIDPSVPEPSALLRGKRQGYEVFWIDRTKNGLEQMTKVLLDLASQEPKVQTIHIVSHGFPGQLDLGSSDIDLEELKSNEAEVVQWQESLAPQAEIFLYGCSMAANEKGRQFTQLLKTLTQAEVAASTGLTGAHPLGGDWKLEYKTGRMSFPLAFEEETLRDYQYILKTP